MKAILLQDHYSIGKDKTLYGIKNDIVTIIWEQASVSIVENSLGNRFPIKSTLLQTLAT